MLWGTPFGSGSAVFYLVPEQSNQIRSRAVDTTISQVELQFSPYISVVQVGSQVHFPNKDATAHHVYSFSQAKAFELPLYKNEIPIPLYFNKPGVVILGCNIHDWMEAYILVVDTPYYQMVTSGKTTFRNIASGTYTLHFWYPGTERKAPQTRKVVLASDTETLHIDFLLSGRVKKMHQSIAPDNSEFSDEY